MLISLGRECSRGEIFNSFSDWPVLIPSWEKKLNLVGKDTEKVTHPDTCIENVFAAPYSLCIFVSQLRSVK